MKRLIYLYVAIVLAGCDSDMVPPDTYQYISAIPPAPTNLNVTVGDRSLRLYWQMPDTTPVTEYRIYRADGDGGEPEFTFVGTAQGREFDDTNLHNGRLYAYRVAAVSSNKIESYLSTPASGTPNLYALSISNGDSTTSTRSVTLSIVAPATTIYMIISNSEDSSGGSWEPFAYSKQWLLTSGEGLKTVYGVFRDSSGNVTSEYASDDILFEILPYRYSIIANDDDVLSYSRNIDLTLSADAGTYFMKIADNADFDGADWEGFAPFRQWFLQPESFDNRDTVTFYARFLDQNGDSIPVQVSDSIILASNDPVELFDVRQPADYYQSVELQWTRTTSEDFHAYRLFRSQGTDIVDTMIANISSANVTNYTDNVNVSDILETDTMSVYYMLRSYSMYEDSSDSDTILAVLINARPDPITCFISDIVYDSNDVGGMNVRATIEWSRSEIPDFSRYMVYENTVLDSATSSPVAFVYDVETLSRSITKSNVDTTTVYYYWLRVFDIGGECSRYSAPDSIYY